MGRNCAFVTYYSRQAVEIAILNFSTSINIKGITLILSLVIPKKQISDELKSESIPIFQISTSIYLLKSIWGTTLPNFSNLKKRGMPYDAINPEQFSATITK